MANDDPEHGQHFDTVDELQVMFVVAVGLRRHVQQFVEVLSDRETLDQSDERVVHHFGVADDHEVQCSAQHRTDHECGDHEDGHSLSEVQDDRSFVLCGTVLYVHFQVEWAED